MQTPDAQEVILGLRPLWANTQLSPELPPPSEDPFNVQCRLDLESQDPTRRILGEVGLRIIWEQCQNVNLVGSPCFRVWNQLMTLPLDNVAERRLCVACYDEEQAAEKHQKELAEYLLRTIGPHGIQRYGFANFEPSVGNATAYQAARQFDPRKDNLFLWGPCGTGKTHLAGAILKEACGKNLTVKWVKPLWLERELRGAFRQEEEALLTDLATRDLLIIDDVGIGRELNTVLRMLYEITDRRLALNKNGLVITSNESLDDLARAYKDDRIVSRIAGLCRVFGVTGDDWRLHGTGE